MDSIVTEVTGSRMHKCMIYSARIQEHLQHQLQVKSSQAWIQRMNTGSATAISIRFVFRRY